jgi:hypothetical protein
MAIVTAFSLALRDGWRTFRDSWWARCQPDNDFIAMCVLDRIEGDVEMDRHSNDEPWPDWVLDDEGQVA